MFQRCPGIQIAYSIPVLDRETRERLSGKPLTNKCITDIMMRTAVNEVMRKSLELEGLKGNKAELDEFLKQMQGEQ